MPSGFGYVQREADSYVNWADVGQSLATTFDDIQRDREEKKALLEKTFREDLDYILSQPSGEDESLSSWSIDYGNRGAEMLKLQYNLLKQGKSNIKNYTSFRQNLTDDTENLYGVLKDLQGIYKKKSDRYKAGDSQDLETHEMALLERYGNLADTLPYINDLSGSVTIGLTEQVEKDGKTVRQLKKDPNSIITVTGLKAAANAEYNNYNPMNDLEKWANSQGEKLNSFRKIGTEFQAGQVTEVIDVTGEKLAEITDKYGDVVTKFKEAETDYLDKLMANDYNKLAMLTNQMKFDKNGKQFKLTYDEKDLKNKDSNYILLKRVNGRPIPDFQPEQTDELREWLRGQARVMYDQKVSIDTYTEVGRQYQQPNEAAGIRADKITQMKNIGNAVGQAFYGKSPEEIEAALNYIKGLSTVKNTKDAVQRKKDKLIIKLENGKVLTQSLTGNSKDFGRAYATGLYGDDVNYDVFLSTFKDLPANTTYENKVEEAPKTLSQSVQSNILPGINADLFITETGGNNKAVASTLSSKLSKLGLTVSPNGYYGLNVSYMKDGKEIKKAFITEYAADQNKDAATQAENLKSFINDYISNLSVEKQNNLSKNFKEFD